MKSEGRTEKELEESYCFLLADNVKVRLTLRCVVGCCPRGRGDDSVRYAENSHYLCSTVIYCFFVCLGIESCVIAILYQLKHLFPGGKQMGIMHSYDDNLCLHGGRALIRKNVRLPCSSDF